MLFYAVIDLNSKDFIYKLTVNFWLLITENLCLSLNTWIINFLGEDVNSYKELMINSTESTSTAGVHKLVVIGSLMGSILEKTGTYA